MSIFTVGHFQRPGVPSNLTIEEWANAQARDGYMVVSVKGHTLADSHPAGIVLDKEDYDIINGYYKYVRGGLYRGPRSSKVEIFPSGQWPSVQR